MSGGITGPVSDHRRLRALSRRDLIGAGAGVLAGAVGVRPALAQPATPAFGGPAFLATPSTVGWDQPFSLYLSGAEPEARIAISSSVVVGIQAWGARAEYETNAFGGIDFARDVPIAGDFTVPDPMAFIWAASPVSRVDRGGATDEELLLVASVDEEEIARVGIRRTLLSESYRPEHLNTPERVGALYRPVDQGEEPAPVIIRLGGSEGGVPLIDNIAPLLASHGYAVLSLAYFQAGDLPKTLEHIPLEYFGDTIEWLHEQEGIDPGRTGVFGTSRGGELALLLGAHFPAISSVVSVNGSGVVNRGIGPSFSHTEASAWSWQGEDLSYPEWEGTVDYTPPPETQIPVEQTNGPVLLIAGEADLLWPSTELSRYAWDRLRDADRPHPDQFLRYPGAGHAITAPYIPMSGSTFTPLPGAEVGGTVVGITPHPYTHGRRFSSISPRACVRTRGRMILPIRNFTSKRESIDQDAAGWHRGLRNPSYVATMVDRWMRFSPILAEPNRRLLRAPRVTVARLETRREHMMQSAPRGAKVPGAVRPTQLVAEALIDRHDPEELTSRARRLGYSRDLTETVVAVCCRNHRPGDSLRRPAGSAD